MGITEPLVFEIGYRTWLVNELGCNNMYVLEGSERSLVIDAGMGYCKFREIVETITQKPYDVVITHAHPDHIGMMHQFDRIYINKKEVEGNERFAFLTRLNFNMDEFIWNNRQHLGHWEVWTPTEDVICRGKLNTEIFYIDEGKEFNLGDGRIVSSFNLPGHSKGHMYFTDSGSRIAFTGDCVNFNNGTSFHAASTHIRYLQRLLNQYGVCYDRIFSGHCTYCGRLDVYSMEIKIVENLIEAHRAFLRGEALYAEVPNHLHPELPPRKKIVYGEGKYHVEPQVPPSLWEEGEEHVIP